MPYTMPLDSLNVCSKRKLCIHPEFKGPEFPLFVQWHDHPFYDFTFRFRFRLNGSLFSSLHFITLFIWLWKNCVSSRGRFYIIRKRRYMNIWTTQSTMSLTPIRNNVGPRILPFGTPNVGWNILVTIHPIFTNFRCLFSDVERPHFLGELLILLTSVLVYVWGFFPPIFLQ